MKSTVPPLIAAFIAAGNGSDAAAYAGFFATDGVVRDEGKVYRGRAAIAAWHTLVREKYHATAEVRVIETLGDITVLTNEVSGEFDGSPIELRYRLKFAGDQIKSLGIAP